MIKKRIVAVLMACMMVMMTIPSSAFGGYESVKGQMTDVQMKESDDDGKGSDADGKMFGEKTSEVDTSGKKSGTEGTAADADDKESEKEGTESVTQNHASKEEKESTQVTGRPKETREPQQGEDASLSGTPVQKAGEESNVSEDGTRTKGGTPVQKGGEESKEKQKEDFPRTDESEAVLESISPEKQEDAAQKKELQKKAPHVDEEMQESKIVDSVTEEYVKENADPAYTKTDKLEIVNMLIVKQTLGDASAMTAGDTIQSVMQENQDFMSVVICMLEGVVAVYDLSDESDYYVAYADTMHNDSTSRVWDAIFAHSNDRGEAVNGHYDFATGLAYIPKSAYQVDGKTGIGEVQIQLLQAVSDDGSDMESETIVVTDDEKDITTEVACEEVYEMTTTVDTQSGLDESEMLVSVNGIPASEEMYEYHSSTGELEVYQSPAMVQSVSVQGGEETLLGKIRNFFRPLSANAATYNTMQAVSNKKIEISEKLKEGYYFYDEEAMVRYTSASATANTYIPYGDDILQGFAEWIVSGKGSIDASNLTVSTVLNQFQVQLHTLSDKYIDFAELEGVIATLRCSHITLAAGGITNTNHPTVADAWRTNTVGVRVIKINETAEQPYIICGMLTQKVNTQNGAGLFKIYIKKSEEAALRIKKVLSSDVTAYIASAQMLNAVDYDAKFNIYTDKELTTIAKDVNGNACRRIQAKKNGNTEKIKLAPGTYWIKEVEPPDKLSLNDPVNKPGKCVKKVVLESGEKDVQVVKFSNNFYCTWFRLVKMGDDKKPVQGAVYGIYSDAACKTIIAKGMTGADGKIGNAQSLWNKYDKGNNTWEETMGNLLVDTDYYIKEISSPLGYALDSTVYHVRPTVKDLGKYNEDDANVAYARLNNTILNVTERHVSVKVRKVSANPEITEGNPCYSYEGAEFKIYSDQACTKEVTTLVTDENGLSNEETGLGAGHTYYVREERAPEGFKRSDETRSFTLTYENPSQTVEFPDEPISDPGILEIYKVDAETGEAVSQGDGSLEGAQFELNYYAGYYEKMEELPASPTRSWVFQSLYDEEIDRYRVIYDDRHKVSGDELYKEPDNGYAYIPLGTMTIQEIAGSKGYAAGGTFRYKAKDGQVAYMEDDVFFSQLRAYEDGIYVMLGKQVIEGSIAVEEEVYRGDVELRKVNADTGKPMKGVKFQITSKKTGETQTIVSDAEGIASTASSHIKHTDRDGIWFGSGKPDDEKGALPYGEYEIREITDELTYGKDPFDAVFTIDEETAASGMPVKLTFKSDGEVVNETVQLKTTAVTAETETKNIPMEGVFTISDTVEYENLTPGRTYTFIMTPMVKETEKPFLVDGEPVSVEKEVRIEEANGSVEMSFELSAGDVTNNTLVMFEKILYRGEEIQHHEDLESEEQSIYKPAIGTSLRDAEGGTGIGTFGENVTLTDTIHFENLCPDVEYQVSGKLMDRETEEPLLIAGEEVVSSAFFTPQASSGTVDVNYTLDTTGLKNKALVAFETLTENDVTLAEHADIYDLGQTVFFPELGTSARDSDTKVNITCADDAITIEDTVSYYNLIPNWEYTVKGVLMDRETGEPALDEYGNTITAETVFVAPEAEEGQDTVDGEAVVYFNFAGTHLAGKTLVAFETLYYEDCEYAVHKDLKDDAQTVYIPKIGTTLTDKSTKAHISHAEKKITLVDTVHYENLVPGCTYTMAGILYDKNLQKPLAVGQYRDGKLEKTKEVTVMKTFTPEEAEGSVELEFTVDASAFAGKSVVAFEKLLYGEGEEAKVAAVHEDIKDEGQTVSFPSMRTSASIGNKKEAAESKSIKVVDKVECRGLQVGRQITITGVLMDKAAGKELLINGKKVEASKTFRVKKQNCTAELTFTFDASGLGDRELVAFERAYDAESGIQIAEHEDINDKEQTVKIMKDSPKSSSPPSPSPSASSSSGNPNTPSSGLASTIASAVKTGDVQPVMALSILVFLAAAVAAGGIYLKRKRR